MGALLEQVLNGCYVLALASNSINKVYFRNIMWLALTVAYTRLGSPEGVTQYEDSHCTKALLSKKR